jgi:CRP/FNR family cyclic AMP-dependent transcriptional regulator
VLHAAQYLHSPWVSLLDAEPDLALLLPDDQLDEARETLVARRQVIRSGPWDGDRLRRAPVDNVGLLILDGLLAREIAMADNVSSHLLGPGDLVRPWQRSDPGQLLRAESRWTVLVELHVAVLDRHVGTALARYPEVNAMLIDRLSEQMHRLAINQAVSQLNGVDRRLLALFWHLAERWGRVLPDGVLVPIAVSHDVLARLVGARRPTVTTALSRLVADGTLQRTEDRTWLLTGEPVGQPTGQAARIILRRTRRFERRELAAL